MPLTMANGLARDFERLKRFRTMLTTTVANIAPLQGEYNGGPIPHMLLLGRRGQPFFWSPFENTAGNHNVAVFGKSGSGKRSEEHTSELQSLMRHSYAVFCLKKKKHKQKISIAQYTITKTY